VFDRDIPNSDYIFGSVNGFWFSSIFWPNLSSEFNWQFEKERPRLFGQLKIAGESSKRLALLLLVLCVAIALEVSTRKRKEL
jgi:hypothetical protein